MDKGIIISLLKEVIINITIMAQNTSNNRLFIGHVNNSENYIRVVFN